MESSSQALETFHRINRKFRRTCQQLRLLNHRIEDAQMRYDRAYKKNRRSFRYTCRLQLATLEGMRNMFYEYACNRADELEVLQDELITAGLISHSSDTDEDDM
jgi:hypothetical protein